MESFFNEEGAYSLYNLKDDIGETNDLATEKTELVKKLSDKLKKWRKSVNAQEMKINPNYDLNKADWRFKDRKGYYWDNGVVKTD